MSQQGLMEAGLNTHISKQREKKPQFLSNITEFLSDFLETIFFCMTQIDF